MKKSFLNKSGFTLVEAMIVVLIVSLVAVTFYSVFSIGIKTILDSKNRLKASALANEKMEIIKNLDYGAIGTKKDDGLGGYYYGVPAGDILEYETLEREDKEFFIHTTVQYIDDSYDGTEDGNPDDEVPNDYKTVSVKVSWEADPETKKAVYLVSRFSPQGLEQKTDGGTLSINVINNEGLGVSEALVNIHNSDTDVDVDATTDSSGKAVFPGTPSGNQNYELKISKNGYYSVQTYSPYPESAFDPVDVNASVIEGRLNVKSMIMDRHSDLKIVSRDALGKKIPKIDFNIKGGKKIGNVLVDGKNELLESVYDFNLTGLKTNESGEKDFSDLSFGMYYLDFPDSNEYDFVKLDDGQEKFSEINLVPGENKEVSAIFAKKDFNSLLITVKTKVGESETVIADAEVELKNYSLGYNLKVRTDQYGLAYFPDSSEELLAGNYEISVSASGCQNKTETVEINKLVKKEIILEKE